MNRCLELASNGLGYVAPNPLVGCVIVHEDKIIGEGYHRAFGTPHAEIHALESISDKSLLPDSILYVNLEPCSHYGKTPPCSDMIIQSGIRQVVIANQDPNEKVNGRGINKLKEAGIKVRLGLLENEAKFLNRRFYIFHSLKRPYIILKWAQTADGYIDRKREETATGGAVISGKESRQLVHKWRSEEQSIMVGTNTVQLDNPELTTRLYNGKNPIRIVIDRKLSLDSQMKVFNDSAATLVLNESKSAQNASLEYIAINFDDFAGDFCSLLYERNIQSVFVEGGSKLLDYFIQNDLWDEVRIFTSRMKFGDGVNAPEFKQTANESLEMGNDFLEIMFKENR